MKRFVSATLVYVTVVGLVGCAGSQRRVVAPRQEAVSSNHDVSVSLGSFFVHPAHVTVGAGKVELLVRNRGTESHELVIVKTNSPANRLPVQGARVDESEAGANYGEADDLGPGEHRSLGLSLTPGRYVMFCNLPEHYRMGMYAVLTVR